MNQMERLQNDLRKRFPEHISATIDAPETGKGSWFLDLRREGEESSPFLVVEWRPDRGFGISTPRDDDFGIGPDEVYPNLNATFDRIVRLVETGGETEPPGAVKLAELRQSRGLSQQELAEKAGVKQANIARIEGRNDIRLSTLVRVLSAMGAELSLTARFPDGTERELKF